MADRHYWVITKTPSFRVKTKVVGLERANTLVKRNKEVLDRYGLYGSVFIRRIKRHFKNKEE